MIYLASPYTSRHTGAHARQMEQHARFTIVTRYAAHLKQQGLDVFSPITHGHPIYLASLTALDPSAAGWEAVNAAMMAASDACTVLAIKGWAQSSGVRAEIQAFEARGIAPKVVPLPACWFDTVMLKTYCQP